MTAKVIDETVSIVHVTDLQNRDDKHQAKFSIVQNGGIYGSIDIIVFTEV